MNRRPISILILSIVFLIVGLGGFFGGAWSILGHNLTSHERVDAGLKILSGVLALISGLFMLRAANWARFLCLIWLALHVLLSLFHNKFEVIVHALLLLIAGYILFRPAAAKYFTLDDQKLEVG